MLSTILIFILVLSIILYVKSCRHPKNYPPGPRLPLPLVGDGYLLGQDFNAGFTSLIKKYGKMVGFWLGPSRAVLISDFDILQDVLNRHETTDRGFSKEAGGMIRGGLSSDSGVPGIFFSSGSTWVETRRASLHFLKNFGFGKDSMDDSIDEGVVDLLQHIDDNWINTPLDVSQLFNVAVLASLWRMTSGESLCVGDPKLTDLCGKARALIFEFSHPLVAITSDFPKVFSFLNKIGCINVIKRANDIIEFCRKGMESCNVQEIDGENPSTFIEAMLYKIEKTDDVTHPLHGDSGKLNLLNIIMDFFLAGSDTIALVLNWAMLFMINNPDIQDKVRDELLANVGSTRTKMSDRQSTPYTEAVIHEILRRAHFTDFSLFHQTTASLTIGELKIPSNTTIVPMTGEIMHDPKHFPNPMEFNPNRFLKKIDDGTMKFTPSARVVPFGIGKRRCIGENFAKATIYKFFTGIVQEYRIISDQEKPLLEATTGGFVLAPLPYKLKFVKV